VMSSLIRISHGADFVSGQLSTQEPICWDAGRPSAHARPPINKTIAANNSARGME
jgi:hypothetical protein